MINGQLLQDIFIAIGLIGGILVYTRSRIPQQTVKNLQALVDTYEKRIKLLEDDLASNHEIQLKNVAAIGELQGQVKVYKELPLRELADSISKLIILTKDNAKSNSKILEVLTESALVAANTANDGGLLVKTKPNTPITVKMEDKE